MKADDHWYTVSLQPRANVYPVVIAPGEFGHASAENLSNVYSDWEAARVTLDLERMADGTNLGEFTIESLEIAARGTLSGVVANSSEASIGE